jgi:hypothetical protein
VAAAQIVKMLEVCEAILDEAVKEPG